MKCPTCGYIGFETSDRCRNCGYDFAMAARATPSTDRSLREAESGGALDDLDLADARSRADGDQPADLDRVMRNLDRVLGGPAAPDLPLFEGEDLPPLVSADAPPRRPLAVRRATPDPSRLRARPVRHARTAGEPELPLPAASPDPPPAASRRRHDGPAVTGAPPVPRMLAALTDAGLLGAINLIVVYFTLKMCGLTTTDVGLLPPIPLAAFFVIVNGGYLAAFTAAGGQTIGKMAFGLKVVSGGGGPVSGGLATLRAAGCLASIATFGLGFLPAVLAEGGRAVEDRLADTRVVQVGA